jgi:hypothetical protein
MKKEKNKIKKKKFFQSNKGGHENAPPSPAPGNGNIKNYNIERNTKMMQPARKNISKK